MPAVASCLINSLTHYHQHVIHTTMCVCVYMIRGYDGVADEMDIEKRIAAALLSVINSDCSHNLRIMNVAFVCNEV